MVKQFNKPNLREIRASMKVALRAVEAEYGIAVNFGHGSYTAHEVTFKTKLSILDEAGDSRADKSSWELYATRKGFAAEDFGKEITLSGNKFRISGWSIRRWKLPIQLTEVATGRLAFASVASVLYNLHKF